MEARQKWVNLTFILAGVLLGYVVLELLAWFSAYFDFEARFKEAEMAIRGISVLSGLLLFIVLYKKDSTQQFMHEVVAEMVRVTWPTTKDTTGATIVVIITVCIAGVILGALDLLWTVLLQKMI